VEDLRDSRPPLIELVPGERPNLLLLLPYITGELSRVDKSPREYEILKRRYGFSGSSAYTLEEIGSYYGLTRERVRQLEDRARKRLLAVVSGNADGMPFRVPAEIPAEFKALKDVLHAEHPLLRGSGFAELLLHRYGGSYPPEAKCVVPLLIELAGGSRIGAAGIGLREDPLGLWRIGSEVDPKRIGEIVRFLRRSLEQSLRRESLFHLTVSFNRLRKTRVSPEDVRYCSRLMEEIEEIAPDEFHLRFEHVRSLADRAYVVLLAEEQPLHYKQLARKINQRLIAAGCQPALELHRSLSTQLSGDRRFEPVAKSGFWKLSEWSHVRTDPIVDLMQEALVAKHEPATIKEICQYVRQHRPEVRETSMYALVSMRDDLFVKHGGGKVALAAWGLKPHPDSQPRKSREVLNQEMKAAILNLVAEAGTVEFPLVHLVREIESRTGYAHSTVRARLARASWAEVFGSESRRAVRIDVAKIEKDQPQNRPPGRVREKIEGLVTEFLAEQPAGRGSAVDLWKHVQRRSKIKRPTLYAVLAGMAELKKDREGKRAFFTLRGFQDDKPMRLPDMDSVLDERLRSDLELAESNLTLRNIDTGLFQLGKILEGQLKAFLTKAQKVAAFPVSNKDLSSFSNMIDCVVKNGIIRTGHQHHLTLLREQRNDRAHGAIPSESERRQMMAHAPFLIHLSMRYITLMNAASSKLY
jgi:hypothetical protein